MTDNIVPIRPPEAPRPKQRIAITPNDRYPGEFIVGLETEGRPYVLLGPCPSYREAVEYAQDRSEALGGVIICDFTRPSDNAWANRDPEPAA